METGNMRNLAEVVRDEMLMRRRIFSLLEKKPMTIPELAEALDKPGWEVTAWVMSMRRYNLLTELPKGRGDDYFQYSVSKDETE
jgi:hypothetical protein